MARKKQDTLVLFPELLSATRRFTDEQFGILIRAAFAYRFYGEVYSGEDMAIDVAFQIVANQIDRYQEYCSTLANNAKGSNKQQNPAKNCIDVQGDTPIHSMSNQYPIQSVPLVKNKNGEQFTPPSQDMVRDYCVSEGITNVDPERFVSYYSANGWMMGKTRMVDWKSAVQVWDKSEYSHEKKQSIRESGMDRMARLYKEENEK